VQFSCSDCPASYTVQNQYRRHLKVRHCKTIDILGNVVEIAPEKAKSKAIQKKQDDQKINPKRKNRRKAKVPSKPGDQLVQGNHEEDQALLNMTTANPLSQNHGSYMRTVPEHLTADYHYGDTTSNDEEVEEFSQVSGDSRSGYSTSTSAVLVAGNDKGTEFLSLNSTQEPPVIVSQPTPVVSLIQPGTILPGSGARPIFLQPGSRMSGMQQGTIIFPDGNKQSTILGGQARLVQPAAILSGNNARLIAPATGLLGNQPRLLHPGTILSGNPLRLVQPAASNQAGYAILPAHAGQSNEPNFINNNIKDENSPVVFVVPNEASHSMGVSKQGTPYDHSRRPLMVTSQQGNQKILEHPRTVTLNKPADMKQIEQQVLVGQINKQKVLLVPKKLEEASSTKMSFLQPIERSNRLSEETFWKVPTTNANQSTTEGSYNIPISTLDAAKFIIASEPEKTLPGPRLESQTSIVTTVHSKPRVASNLCKDTYSAISATKETFPTISAAKGTFSTISVARETFPTISLEKDRFPNMSATRESFPTMSATLLGHKVIKVMHSEEKVEQETSRLEHYLKYGTVYGYPETPQTPVKNKTNTEVSFSTLQRPKMSEAALESPTKSNILEQALQHVFPSSQLDNMTEMMSDASENSDESLRTSDYSSQDFSFYDESEKLAPVADNLEGIPKAQVNVYNPKKSPLENRNKILCDILGIGAEYVPSQ